MPFILAYQGLVLRVSRPLCHVLADTKLQELSCKLHPIPWTSHLVRQPSLPRDHRLRRGLPSSSLWLGHCGLVVVGWSLWDGRYVGRSLFFFLNLV